MRHYPYAVLPDGTPRLNADGKHFPACSPEWVDLGGLEPLAVLVNEDEADRIDCPGCLEFLAKQVSGILGDSTSGRRVHGHSYTAVRCIKDGTLHRMGGRMKISYTPFCRQPGKNLLMSSRREEINCTKCGGYSLWSIPWGVS